MYDLAGSIVYLLVSVFVAVERITQNVVKSHMETSQYSVEELKRLAWTSYNADETRCFQNKVRVLHALFTAKVHCVHFSGNHITHAHCVH